MLKLSLAAIARGPVRLREQIPPDDPLWNKGEIGLNGPLQVDLEARSVGEGVLVRGQIEGDLEATCRRCLTPVSLHVRDTVDMLFEALSPEDGAELNGEVYALPERGDRVDLSEALREQLILRIPDYVVCSESCRGLCPQCGADLNHETCECRPKPSGSPWDALKRVEFD